MITEFMIMQHKPKKYTLFNNLIQFFMSTTRFEPRGFIIRTTICTSSFCVVCFSCTFVSSVAGGRVCYDSVKDLHVPD